MNKDKSAAPFTGEEAALAKLALLCLSQKQKDELLTELIANAMATHQITRTILTKASVDVP